MAGTKIISDDLHGDQGVEGRRKKGENQPENEIPVHEENRPSEQAPVHKEVHSVVEGRDTSKTKKGFSKPSFDTKSDSDIFS